MGLATALIGAKSAEKAADAQTEASDNSIAYQRESRDMALNLQRPQREAGYRATAALMDLTGLSRGTPTGSGDATDLASYDKFDFKTDPGYQFRIDEGMRGVERGAAARGGLLSGGYGRSAIRYAEDYASTEYQNVYNRIAAIAGYGGQSASQGATTSSNFGTNAGNTLVNAGEARASGYIAANNAYANSANNTAQIAGKIWGS